MDLFGKAQVYGMDPHPGDILREGFQRARSEVGLKATTYVDQSR